MLQFLLGVIAAALSGGVAFYFLRRKKEELPPRGRTEEASSLHLSEARERLQKIEEKALETEERLTRWEENLEKRADNLEKRQARLLEKEELVEHERAQLEEELQKRAGLTKEEARERLLASLREELVSERARIIKEAEEEAEAVADERAKEILVSAMERAATDYVSETTVTTVKLPNEETKGRIIGREGRNIKALERATGVDFEIDETPGEVRLSSFDPLRREIAKRALERLIAEGRIQPARIEETVKRVKEEFEREIRKAGKDLAYRVGVTGLPNGIFELLGRLKFRTSYGQDQAEHTLEVVNLTRALAREVGAREDLAARAALLHDIGKVKTVEEGGSHVELGKAILRKFHFDDELIHAAMAHHRDEEFQSIEAALVYIADAISGSRPGARFEDYETYIQRIEQLEKIAKSFEGVADAFAVSAGREVRVLVKPEEISDDAAVTLAHDIAGKIQSEATYPGTVKVNVIREVRAMDMAK